MSKTIYKYELINSPQELEIPEGAEILALQIQPNRERTKLCLWALVDPERSAVKRSFVVIGTGHDVPEKHSYVGTWQEGPLVWHLFEVWGETK